MFKRLFIILLLIIASGEIYIRYRYGFCDAPLMIESDKYELIAAPNQKRKRFGNNVIYNSFSQRSGEPERNRKKILVCGDSVLNGGVQTDNKDLATTLIAEETEFQMLNISAGSWGPDNCAAYLEEKGLFDAEAIFLVVSSDDVVDIMDFRPIVDVHKSYPSKQYKSAYIEILHRYLPKYIRRKNKNDFENNEEFRDELFNPGFEKLKSIARHNDIPFVIYLHPDIEELICRKYNMLGQRIIQWSDVNNIPLYKVIEYDETINHYRDRIHINKEGQRVLANTIKIMINENIRK